MIASNPVTPGSPAPLRDLILTERPETTNRFECDCVAPPVEIDNDCRYPGLPPMLAAVQATHYVHPRGAHVAPLPHGFYLVQSPQTTTGPAVLAPAAFGRWQRFCAPAALVDEIDRWLAALALLQPLGTTPALCAGPADTLTAWLHVSNACNLDCPYCYVRKSSARMSEATGRRAVEAVFANAARHSFHTVKLKYAGGEAALHFALVRQLHEHALRLAAESGIALRDVNMVVTGRNAHGAADLARWTILERALPTTFTFYRPNLLSRDRAELQFEEAALVDGMLAAYRTLEQDLPTWPFTGGLLDRVSTEARTHACGVGQNYLVIGHTGALSQCPMHLEQPVRSDLDGDLLATVAAGPLLNLPVDQKAGCRDCTFRYRCAGGCPLETFRATGRWDVQSPNCHLYQTLLPAALRLEGLRLMKVNGYLQ